MKLNYSKKIKNNIVSVYLSITEITEDEMKACKELGNLNIAFNKTYSSGKTIDMNRKLFTEFTFNTDFEATEDTITLAIVDANNFINDIANAIREKLFDFMAKYRSVADLIDNANGYIEINTSVTPDPDIPTEN